MALLSVQPGHAHSSSDGMKRIDSCQSCGCIDAIDEQSLCLACAPVRVPSPVVARPVERLTIPRNVLVFVRIAPAS